MEIKKEQVTGIEPASAAWEAAALPLGYTCVFPFPIILPSVPFVKGLPRISYEILFGRVRRISGTNAAGEPHASRHGLTLFVSDLP